MSIAGGVSSTINSQVDDLVNLYNTVVTPAAGNYGANANTLSPASAAQSLTVGASDSGFYLLASFSNYGVNVRIAAPGVATVAA